MKAEIAFCLLRNPRSGLPDLTIEGGTLDENERKKLEFELRERFSEIQKLGTGDHLRIQSSVSLCGSSIVTLKVVKVSRRFVRCPDVWFAPVGLPVVSPIDWSQLNRFLLNRIENVHPLAAPELSQTAKSILEIRKLSVEDQVDVVLAAFHLLECRRRERSILSFVDRLDKRREGGSVSSGVEELSRRTRQRHSPRQRFTLPDKEH